MQHNLTRSEMLSFIRHLETENMVADAINGDIRDVLKQEQQQEALPQSNMLPLVNNDISNASRLPSFRFGVGFFPWKFYEGGHIHNFVRPKYHNLKEECLQNTIYPIGGSVFANILEMARTLWRTHKGRSLKAADKGINNLEYEIPADCPMSISHIFVLLMYCNFTVLQNIYKKMGCRETTDVQAYGQPGFTVIPGFDALKERNIEIAWWYRQLREAVMFWGNLVCKNDVFYTGLDCKMVFDSMVPLWGCPFSTTVSSLVALNFATEQGSILRLVPTNGSWDTYFDCEWLSEYPDERERLFGCGQALQLTDIRTFDFEERLWTTHSEHISCLSLFSRLLDGHYVSHLLKSMENIVEMEKVMLSMLHRYAQNNLVQSLNDDADGVRRSLYAEQLCNAMMESFKNKFIKHYVIKSQCQSLSKRLQRALVQFDDEDNMMISPFLKSLSCSLNNTVLQKEYIWQLTKDDIVKLNALTPGTYMESDELYSFRGYDGCAAIFRMAVNRNASGTGFAAFVFRIEWSSHSTVMGRLSVNIEEVNWHTNALKLHPMADGNYCGFFTFRDELYDSINSLTIQAAVWLQIGNSAPQYQHK